MRMEERLGNRDMHRRGEPLLLTGSESLSDLAYIGKFKAPPSMILLRARGRYHIVAPMLEYGRLAEVFAEDQVKTPSMLGLTAKKAGKRSEWILKLLNINRIRRVRVSSSFPLALARELEKAGIHLQVAKGPLFPGRARKDAEELRCIRKAQQAAVIAMRTAVNMIAHSETLSNGDLRYEKKVLSSERVREAMNRALLEQGCFCEDTIVAGGAQGANPHERGHGPLRAGQPIVIDVFPRHLPSGYWGDLTRTLVKGPVSGEWKRMYNAVKAAYTRALTLVRPAMACAAIHAAAADELVKRGYKTEIRDGIPTGFIHGTGHGVGLDVHEEPSVGVNPALLAEGHVITIEPGLYYGGRGGIRIEDTVMVTEKGWRYFAPCEKRFEL